jgi:hypothetical protein
MSILIEKVVSTSVRGWEGNVVWYEEFEGETLREYLVFELEEDGCSNEEIERLLEGGDDFGFVGGVTDQDMSVDYEGEEDCISYRVVTFSSKTIEMFKRHMK